ncbi:MAG: hypothetical protein JW902_12590, partial [Syntrophaceae bacterium]|nr:hypothetical protein [Syntrophaceae bacterium]
RISDAVSEAINKLNVATKDEMKRLDERPTALESQVVRLAARIPEKKSRLKQSPAFIRQDIL